MDSIYVSFTWIPAVGGGIKEFCGMQSNNVLSLIKSDTISAAASLKQIVCATVLSNDNWYSKKDTKAMAEIFGRS